MRAVTFEVLSVDGLEAYSPPRNEEIKFAGRISFAGHALIRKVGSEKSGSSQ
jgi:hypothetical protein